ncbi:raffinose/stachyose/melibiose transport system substrate-binding protein [Rhizobium leguminosarum]
MRKLSILAAVLVTGVSAITSAAFADTTVKIFRSETTPEERAFNEDIAKKYEAAHPGVDISFEYAETEAFKQKLPTLLQSNDRPDIFYSWSGGVLKDEAAAGFLKDISADMNGDWAKSLSAAGVNAFRVDGKVVGVPVSASDVGFWVNKTLAAKAGIDPSAIKTWDDFLEAVKKAKAAGITPIVAGGKDKWPLHFYYGYLALREAGQKGFADAMAGEGEGFASEAFVKAGQEFKRLIELDPFQKGFMDTTFSQASGMFGDGKAVFHLMGDWDYSVSKQNSASGKGVADTDLAFIRFPAVQGGAGSPTDTFGGINGWAVTSSAKPEAVDFLKFFTTTAVQSESAEKGFFIPVAIGAEKGLKNPFFAQMSKALGQSTFHQVFLDQTLGANVGATFNDVSADLAQGNSTPEDAAAAIQDAWANR